MNKLINLGWNKTSTTLYETYSKTINDYTIQVTKHINGTNWIASIQTCEEIEIITLNHDASFDWVIQLTDILQLTK